MKPFLQLTDIIINTKYISHIAVMDDQYIIYLNIAPLFCGICCCVPIFKTIDIEKGNPDYWLLEKWLKDNRKFF